MSDTYTGRWPKEYNTFTSTIDFSDEDSPRNRTARRFKVLSEGGGTVVIRYGGVQSTITGLAAGDIEDIAFDEIDDATDVASLRVYW
jgi:hypothetical protein